MISYITCVFRVVVMYTVEPLYNGQVGVGGFVRYKEVSFIGRLVQECICNPYKVLLSCHEVYMIHVHS